MRSFCSGSSTVWYWSESTPMARVSGPASGGLEQAEAGLPGGVVHDVGSLVVHLRREGLALGRVHESLGGVTDVLHQDLAVRAGLGHPGPRTPPGTARSGPSPADLQEPDRLGLGLHTGGRSPGTTPPAP